MIRFLDEYGAVYIKARRNSRGRGIFHLCKTDDGVIVRDHKQRQTLLKNTEQIKSFLDQNVVQSSVVQQPVPFNYGNRVLDFRAYLQKNENRMWTFQGFTTRISIETTSKRRFYLTINALYKVIKRKNYVLQQSVAFKTENRNVDFRVMLQKDATKKWIYTGFTCKVSIENSIITNDKNRQVMIPGREALSSLYHLTVKQAKAKEKEMAELCERLAKTIEESGF